MLWVSRGEVSCSWLLRCSDDADDSEGRVPRLGIFLRHPASSYPPIGGAVKAVLGLTLPLLRPELRSNKGGP